ncbi:MAG: UDP-N-acetylglucosamine 2-epimerase (non-hydrolyzing) [Candidatus Cloacimonetes bacterium]|nr:UDP-N-acetylglucosamine 2-epimerase (non-hydrolyzing) [Candidatus Cloacimonadota bacterium]
MKNIHIVGARPQFVKLAPLSRALRPYSKEIIIHTGQHYDISMSESFFTDLDIPQPDYNLDVGSGSQGYQTARMIEGLENLLIKEKPDLVIVYGDTNSTLAGALVAAKLQIPSAHVEACLRSFNRTMPEEINRIVADHTCDLLLCPTKSAMQNAALEGLQEKSYLVGDIMTDSVSYGKKKAAERSNILQEISLSPKDYYLLTLHRPYNVDDPVHLKMILDGLDKLGKKVIFPVHPRTRKVINDTLQQSWKNVILTEPKSYLDFIQLHQNASLMITDSGGVQKEAYLLKVPCVTLRTETEWIETVESGWNLLLPPQSRDFPGKILSFNPPKDHPELYGSGVSETMAELILKRGIHAD